MIFDKENHTYEIGGKKLISVSKWVDQFIPNFPQEKIAEAVAKKENTTTEKILEKWEKKKRISLHWGNFVHESVEYYLKYDKNFTNEPVEAFKGVCTDNVYHSEVIVNDNEVAGTIDLIEVIEKGKTVKIHDFKTNGDLYKKNGKLLDPYKDLDNSPFNKYRLQLSKYKELLEKMKPIKVIELNLWHYTSKGFEIIKLEPIKI